MHVLLNHHLFGDKIHWENFEDLGWKGIWIWGESLLWDYQGWRCSLGKATSAPPWWWYVRHLTTRTWIVHTIRDWHFVFETSRLRNFCQIFEGFGFEKFGLGKKSRFLKNFISEKSLGFGFGKFGLGRKVLVSVSENLVSEKSLGFGFEEFVSEKFQFRKIWSWKKVFVLVLENLILEKKKSK